jgi:hypothetical protein
MTRWSQGLSLGQSGHRNTTPPGQLLWFLSAVAPRPSALEVPCGFRKRPLTGQACAHAGVEACELPVLVQNLLQKTGRHRGASNFDADCALVSIVEMLSSVYLDLTSVHLYDVPSIHDSPLAYRRADRTPDVEVFILRRSASTEHCSIWVFDS